MNRISKISILFGLFVLSGCASCCVTLANREIEKNIKMGLESGLIIYYPGHGKHQNAVVWVVGKDGKYKVYDPKTRSEVSEEKIKNPWVISDGIWERGTLPKWR